MERKQTMEHTSLLVLSLLQGQDLYGYQMITELERRSDHTFQMKEGTLYPVLKKAGERGGYVTAYQAEANGRTRKYYRLTDRGRKGAGAGEGPVGKVTPTGSTPSSPSSRDEPGSGEVPGLRGGRVRPSSPTPPGGKAAVRQELMDHLTDHTQALLDAGCPPEAAETRALPPWGRPRRWARP